MLTMHKLCRSWYTHCPDWTWRRWLAHVSSQEYSQGASFCFSLVNSEKYVCYIVLKRFKNRAYIYMYEVDHINLLWYHKRTNKIFSLLKTRTSLLPLVVVEFVVS